MKASAGKILIIVQNLPVPFDRRVWLEATTLRDNGYTVSVICPKSPEYRESYIKLDGISIYRYHIPGDASGFLGYVFEFVYAWMMTALLSVKILNRDGFDVIQACNPPDTFFLLGFIYRFFGKEFIFDHHDLAPEMYLAKYGKTGGMLYRILLLMERATLKTARIVLTTNQSYKKVAEARGRKNLNDVYVLRTGPDLNRLKPIAENPNLRNNKKHLVCYLGEMCPQDGVDYLLKSISYLRNELNRNDIQFAIVGGGPAQPVFKKMSSEMGMDDYVVFPGRLPDNELSEFLSTADVCVDPDPLTEWSNYSTMNKILEYMAFAKPIVTFDLVETRFSAGDAALYARPNEITDFAEKIVHLLNNKNQRDEMGAFGYKRVKNGLCWEHTHIELLKAYNRIFNRNL